MGVQIIAIAFAASKQHSRMSSCVGVVYVISMQDVTLDLQCPRVSDCNLPRARLASFGSPLAPKTARGAAGGSRRRAPQVCSIFSFSIKRKVHRCIGAAEGALGWALEGPALQ